MWEQVGKRIEKLRMERGLSKAQFGALINVSGQYVGMIENGSRFSTDVIIRICVALDVTADYILFGTVNPTKDPAALSALEGLSNEQIQIALDIIKKVAQFVNTDDGNEALIQEVARQQAYSANE